MNEFTLQERCDIAAACLPEAPYKTMLLALHGEMNGRIKELEAQLSAPRKPITAEAVTDEMLNEFHDKSEVFPNPETLAIAYNAVNAYLTETQPDWVKPSSYPGLDLT